MPNADPSPRGSPRHRHAAVVQEQFVDLAQQENAALLGMWIFLATEILFFGGLFAAYTVYRWRFPVAFDEASNHLRVGLGTLNTLLLLGSSFTMATAVRRAQLGGRRRLAGWLLLTALLGALFLGIKLLEWHLEANDYLVPGRRFFFPGPRAEQAELFFWLYFAMTGLHALHLTIGIGLLLVLSLLAIRRAFTPEQHAAVTVGGLYWHFIDIVWIFLYPLLYLGGRHLAP